MRGHEMITAGISRRESASPSSHASSDSQAGREIDNQPARPPNHKKETVCVTYGAAVVEPIVCGNAFVYELRQVQRADGRLLPADRVN